MCGGGVGWGWVRITGQKGTHPTTLEDVAVRRGHEQHVQSQGEVVLVRRKEAAAGVAVDGRLLLGGGTGNHSADNIPLC